MTLRHHPSPEAWPHAVGLHHDHLKRPKIWSIENRSKCGICVPLRATQSRRGPVVRLATIVIAPPISER
jgi:hypothetical protein